MHYLTIPLPAVIENMEGPNGEPPTLSFPDFLALTLATSKLWRANEAAIDCLMNITAKARAAPNPGDVLELQNDEWELLVRVAQAHDFDPRVTVFVMPLLRAIIAAPCKRPGA